MNAQNPTKPPEEKAKAERPAGGPGPVILSSAEFVASFVPPDILDALIHAARQLEDSPHYEAADQVQASQG